METIEIEGEFVDQENGITTIKGTVKEILEQIDLPTIKETLKLYSKDEADISWFDDYDIENEYEDRDLGDPELANGLDYIDQKRLDEITELFLKGSFQQREEIYKKLKDE